MRRFEIWMANLPKHDEESHVQRGRRPVVIVSNDIINDTSTVVTVVPITSKMKKLMHDNHEERLLFNE